jgi:phosphoribosylformylglycinamidine cyclo-ligase
LPEGISANIKTGTWPIPGIFKLIEKMGNVPSADMKMTFNMGIGFIIVVSKARAGEAISSLKKAGYPAFIIGDIEKGSRQVRYS